MALRWLRGCWVFLRKSPRVKGVGVVRGRSWPQRASLAARPRLPEHCVHVIHSAELLEEGQEVMELCVTHVVKPRGHRYLGRWA